MVFSYNRNAIKFQTCFFFQITFATFQISALSSKMVDRNYLLTFLMQINAFPQHVRYNSLKAIQLIVAILIKLNYVWKKNKMYTIGAGMKISSSSSGSHPWHQIPPNADIHFIFTNSHLALGRATMSDNVAQFPFSV